MTRRIGPGKLVIATHNAGKLKEISALLAPYGVECLSAGSLGLPEPEETGTTFVDNALLKARAAAEGAGIVSLADDSGLSVAALDGRPGVYTADWAERQWFEGEPGRDWYMAMGKVEGLLAQQGPDVDRSAAFHCTLAHAGSSASATIRYSCRRATSRHSLRSTLRKNTRSATARMPSRSWSPSSSANSLAIAARDP